MKAPKYYVYELIDPRSGLPFYVGKGSGRRVMAHETEARTRTDHPKHARIREIWAAGLEVVRRIVEHFELETPAFKLERQLIARHGQGLCNLSPGGRIGQVPIAEARRDERMLRVLAVIGAKTDDFRAESARWWYCGQWHELAKDTIETFGNKFKHLVAKHGEDWAARVLPAGPLRTRT